MLYDAGFRNLGGATDRTMAERQCTVEPPDLLLVGAGENGAALMKRLRPRTGVGGELPVLVLAPEGDDASWRRTLDAGGRDVLRSPFDPEELHTRVRTLLEIRALRLDRDTHNREIETRERTRMAELEAARLEVVERLARAGEFRDDETGEHTRRVGTTSALLASAAGMDPATARAIGLAAPLHDIGKIAIPDAILLRRQRLRPEEILVMQQHTVIGARMLDGSTSRLLNLARDIALTHHERWDGAGYPAKLSGEDIPVAGRIVALADVFDALTHRRPYKDAWSIEAAVDEITLQSGTQFEPAIVDAFRTLDHESLI